MFYIPYPQMFFCNPKGFKLEKLVTWTSYKRLQQFTYVSIFHIFLTDLIMYTYVCLLNISLQLKLFIGFVKHKDGKILKNTVILFLEDSK